jgi:DNA-binding NarL/FixJ family response regulator
MSGTFNTTTNRITSTSEDEQCHKVVLLNRKQWLYVQNRYNLTPREYEIAELICQGMRNGSIAKKLRIKPGTVKTHIRNIYRKVQVKSRIAMLLRFVIEAQEISSRYGAKVAVHTVK